VDLLTEIITRIRNLRAEMNIEPSRKITVHLAAPDPAVRDLLAASTSFLSLLARCDQVELTAALDRERKHSARTVAAGVEIEVPLEGILDLEVEKARIQKEMAKIEKESEPIEKKLANPDFVAHAPQNVVELNRQRLREFSEKLAKLRENLERL
jgi:valyl-tRNA synthetase